MRKAKVDASTIGVVVRKMEDSDERALISRLPARQCAGGVSAGTDDQR
jgi:hypothetical protein